MDAEQVIYDVHAQEVVFFPSPASLCQLYKG